MTYFLVWALGVLVGGVLNQHRHGEGKTECQHLLQEDGCKCGKCETSWTHQGVSYSRPFKKCTLCGKTWFSDCTCTWKAWNCNP